MTKIKRAAKAVFSLGVIWAKSPAGQHAIKVAIVAVGVAIEQALQGVVK